MRPQPWRLASVACSVSHDKLHTVGGFFAVGLAFLESRKRRLLLVRKVIPAISNIAKFGEDKLFENIAVEKRQP